LADCGSGSSCGRGHVGGLGLGHKKNFAPCHASTVTATGQFQATGQTSVLQAGQTHCRFCGGRGCDGCGGLGLGDPCSGCGGSGVLGGHGGLCGACGGCGLCKLVNCGTGCLLCGGKGCANCLKGLAGKAHGLLGHLAGSTLGLLAHNKLDWFVGAGGPVPLTPGYVPYIVTTRSPRDFLSFPPMNPNDP
jgi:hypothetical protein